MAEPTLDERFETAANVLREAQAQARSAGQCTGHCPACRHPWDDHAEDGCQAPVLINGDSYDCNCAATQ